MAGHALRILMFGRDRALLDTRRLVLLHSGFEVTTTPDLQGTADLLATRRFDLFILCHSLSRDECQAALALAHSLSPDMKNLILDNALTSCPATAEDAILSAFVDPWTLIHTVNQVSHPYSSKS